MATLESEGLRIVPAVCPCSLRNGLKSSSFLDGQVECCLGRSASNDYYDPEQRLMIFGQRLSVPRHLPPLLLNTSFGETSHKDLCWPISTLAALSKSSCVSKPIHSSQGVPTKCNSFSPLLPENSYFALKKMRSAET